MNSLVFETHKERPEGMFLVDLDRTVRIVERRVSHDGIHYTLVDALAVFVHFRNGWPQHVVFVHVIPQHLVDTDLEDAFEVWVHGLCNHTRYTKLVDV